MDAIAGEEYQAQRDIQIRKMVLGLLDIQAGERGRPALPRVVVWPLTVFVVVFWVVTSISDVVTLISLLQGRHVHIDSNSMAIWYIPSFTWLFGWMVFFPRKYLYAGLDALLRAAGEGDSRLAPRVEPEPASTSTITLPADGEELGPFLRWTGKNMADSRSVAATILLGAGIFCAGVGIFLGVLAVFMLQVPPYPFAFAFVLCIGLTLIGMGVWFGASGKRLLREAGWMRRDLAVFANPDGLTWSDRAWRGRKHMWLAWRDIRSFSVVTYRPTKWNEEYHVYILDGGRTRLLWALPDRSSDERLAAHTRLSALVSANSGVPLRDLTPGVIALGAALRSADPLHRSAEDKAFASAQPVIPGVPVDAIRRWYRTFLTIVGTAAGISLIIGIADTIVRWIS